jgi:hypothetical protein
MGNIGNVNLVSAVKCEVAHSAALELIPGRIVNMTTQDCTTRTGVDHFLYMIQTRDQGPRL